MALTKTPIELSSTPSIVDGGNATAITIDSSENVLVGKTTSNAVTPGHELKADGAAWHTADGTFPLFLNRETDDGELIRFRKDNSNVGSIQSRAGVVSTIILDPRTNGVGLTGTATAVIPTNNTGVLSNAAMDIGGSGYAFKDLYLSGGAYLGGTGASNKLEDYEEGTFTPDLSFGGVSAGVSWNIQAGKYTKIGNLVTVSVYLYESTGRGSQTGNATVNIPFNLSSSQPDHWIPISNRQGITAGSNKTLTLFGNAGDALFRFYAGDNSGGNNTGLTHTAFSASGGFEVSFTVTYRTDA